MVTPRKGAKAAQTAAKSRTPRRVPDEQVPAELRDFYEQETAPPEGEVSLAFSTTGDDTEVESEEREELFSVDGRSYTIPKKFGAGVALIYLDLVDRGSDAAVGAILKTVIGPEGWRALLKVQDKIDVSQMRKIMTIVQEKLMGIVEEVQGN